MRVDSRVLSVSWIPSGSVSGAARLPFAIGLARHDEPPPDHVENPRALLEGGSIRQAHELSAWVDFDQSGRPVAWDYAEASSADAPDGEPDFPVLRREPEVKEGTVRFVQTSGGRLGGSLPRRVVGRPFLRLEAPVAWTTLALTIASDGSAAGELVGASPFPRHWIYDADGRLRSKSAEVDYERWLSGSHGGHTPWGDEDSPQFVAVAESALERQLSRRIMGARPPIRRVPAGAMLTEQGDRDDTIFLVLDGVLDVDVGGQTVAEVGPGAIVGERSSLEGTRSATLRARTDCRVVPLRPESLTHDEREQLVARHRREDS